MNHLTKHILLLLTLLSYLCVSGQEDSKKKQVKPWENGKLIISNNKRFIQHTNGTPFFWLGETAWLLPSRSNQDEVNYFMYETQQNGYNVLQISILHNIPAMNVYGHEALPDGYNFKDIDKKGQYNYWKHIDYIVEQAEKRGIYVGIVCVWGTPVSQKLMTVADAKKYGTFLVERYKKYPNIIWIIGGDIRGDVQTEVWQALAKSIRSQDTEHLMTFHPRGRTISTTWFNNEDWLDFNMYQSGHRRYGQRFGDGDYPIEENTEEDNWRFVERSLAVSPIKPVLDGEPSYENIPHGLHNTSERYWQAEDVRRYAYWSVFAGSFGHTYGNNSTMQMMRPGYLASYGAKVPWWDSLHDPGCKQMKYLKDLILAFPFFDRIPDQSIIADTNGKQYERVIATRGTDYMLIYNYTNRLVKIDMNKISGTKKKAWWYSPTDGHTEFIGEFDNGKKEFINDTGYRAGNDWVLIVTDANKNYVEENLQVKNKL